MARSPAAATRPPVRAAAPPPPPPPADTGVSVYEDLWNTATAYDAAFDPPLENETDQEFFIRLGNAVSAVPEDAWDAMSDDAKNWYNKFAEAKGAELPPPDGYLEEGDGDGEAVEEVQEPVAPPVAAPAPATGGSQRGAALARWREEQKALKAAGAAAAPAPATAPPATGRRAPVATAAPVAPPPPSAPGRRAVAPTPAPATAPGRRQAPQAAAPAPAKATVQRQTDANGTSMMEVLRQFIVWNKMKGVDVDIAQVMKHAEDQGFTPQRSTVSGVVTTTRQTMAVMIAYGWAPTKK